MQKLKLDIHTAQILERLVIRAKTLESLVKEDLHVSSRLANIKDNGSFELESVLEKRLFEIEKERNLENVQCWRDLTHVMRDFISVLEALEQARARENLLNAPIDTKYQRSEK